MNLSSNKIPNISPPDIPYTSDQNRLSAASTKKRTAICLECGHTWEARSPNGLKPSRCSACKSHACAWQDELNTDHEETLQNTFNTPLLPAAEQNSIVEKSPHKYTDENTVILQASELLREVTHSNVQVIENPIESFGASPTKPNYAVWQNSEGDVECGVLVHPEIFEILENLTDLISDYPEDNGGLQDLEILMAAGVIEDEDTYDDEDEAVGKIPGDDHIYDQEREDAQEVKPPLQIVEREEDHHSPLTLLAFVIFSTGLVVLITTILPKLNVNSLKDLRKYLPVTDSRRKADEKKPEIRTDVKKIRSFPGL